PLIELSTPKVADSMRSTSRTYTESRPPNERTANMPAAIAIITNEITAWLKMKRKPCLSESRTELAVAGGPSRLMAIVITSQEETKKLRTWKPKQTLAPSHSTMLPAIAGARISETCTACCISALAANNPPGGAIDRSATDCAGMKNAETTARTK